MIRISEPTTVATDYLLALLAIGLGWALWRDGVRRAQRAPRLLALTFWWTALGAFLGGTAHGFPTLLGSAGLARIWLATTWAIGVAGFLFLCAAAMAATLGGWRRGLILAGVVKLAVYAVWMTRNPEFYWVILDYGSAMLVVLGLMIAQARRGGAPAAAALWVVGGIAVSVLGAAIQAARLAPHPHFNHNDLYHVVQMAALILFYRGGRGLEDAVSGRS